MSQRIAYICSPHEGNVENNSALQYCRQVYEAGFMPICPHIHFTRFLDQEKPVERKDGKKMALRLLDKCGLVVVCGEITEEMLCEMLYAKQKHKIITMLEGIITVQSIIERSGTGGTC